MMMLRLQGHEVTLPEIRHQIKLTCPMEYKQTLERSYSCLSCLVLTSSIWMNPQDLEVREKEILLFFHLCFSLKMPVPLVS